MKKSLCILLFILLLASCGNKIVMNETITEQVDIIEPKIESITNDEYKESNDTYVKRNTVLELVNNGYEQSISGFDGNLYSVELISSDKKDFVLVSCKINEEEYNKLDEIDFMDDNYSQKLASFLDSMADRLLFTNLNEYIPNLTEIRKKYVGKTFIDMENDDYWQCSLGNDEDGHLYFEYSNDEFIYAVYPTGGYKELFSLPENYNTLTIKKIEFSDFNDATLFAQ